MGSWLTAITQGAGRLGSEAGQSVDQNLELGLKTIQSQLMQQQIKEGQQRIALEEQRLKQSQSPQEQLVGTPQGGTSAVPYDPMTGKYGDPRIVVPGTPPPPKSLDQELAEAFEKGDFTKASKIIGMEADRYKAEHPEAKLPGPEEQLKVAQQMAQAEGLTPGSKKYNDRVLEIYRPAAAKIVIGGAGGGGGGNQIADYAQSLANGDINIGQVPSKVRGQVLDFMRQNQMRPQRKLNQVEQRQQDAIVTMQPMLDSLQGLLEEKQPDGQSLKNDNSPFASRWEWMKYNTAKVAPEGVRGDLIRQSAALQIMGAAPWVQIGRSKYTYEQIIKHLPNPEDSPKLLYDKVKFLRTVLADQQKSLDKAKGGSMGDMGGSNDPSNPAGLDLPH